MNTHTLRTLRTGSLITIMPPFGGIKPVCHDRHKTVPEFIVILCDQYAHMSSPLNVNVCLQRNDVSKALCKRVCDQMWMTIT